MHFKERKRRDLWGECSPVLVYQPAETAWSIIRPYPEDKDVVTAKSVRAIDNFL